MRNLIAVLATVVLVTALGACGSSATVDQASSRNDTDDEQVIDDDLIGEWESVTYMTKFCTIGTAIGEAPDDEPVDDDPCPLRLNWDSINGVSFEQDGDITIAADIAECNGTAETDGDNLMLSDITCEPNDDATESSSISDPDTSDIDDVTWEFEDQCLYIDDVAFQQDVGDCPDDDSPPSTFSSVGDAISAAS